MAWMWLLIAGAFEVVWAVGLKYTEGFTRLGPSVVTLGAMALKCCVSFAGLEIHPVGNGLCGMDGNWSRGHGHSGDGVV